MLLRSLPRYGLTCGLEIVESITHVTFRSEDDGLEAVWAVADVLVGADLFEPNEHLLVAQPTVPEDGAATLNGLNDLG